MSRGHPSCICGRYLLSCVTEGRHLHTAQGYPSSSTLTPCTVASLFQHFGGQPERGTQGTISVCSGISASHQQLDGKRLPFLHEHTQGQTNRQQTPRCHQAWVKEVPGQQVQKHSLLVQQTFTNLSAVWLGIKTTWVDEGRKKNRWLNDFP